MPRKGQGAWTKAPYSFLFPVSVLTSLYSFFPSFLITLFSTIAGDAFSLQKQARELALENRAQLKTTKGLHKWKKKKTTKETKDCVYMWIQSFLLPAAAQVVQLIGLEAIHYCCRRWLPCAVLTWAACRSERHCKAEGRTWASQPIYLGLEFQAVTYQRTGHWASLSLHFLIPKMRVTVASLLACYKDCVQGARHISSHHMSCSSVQRLPLWWVRM